MGAYNIKAETTIHQRQHLKGGADSLTGTLDVKHVNVGTLEPRTIGTHVDFEGYNIDDVGTVTARNMGTNTNFRGYNIDNIGTVTAKDLSIGTITNPRMADKINTGTFSGDRIPTIQASENPSQPTRSLDTVYQNTTGYPLMVVVSFTCSRTNTGDKARAKFLVENANPPTTNYGVIGFLTLGTDAVNQMMNFSHTIIVPDNWRYKVEKVIDGSGIVNTDIWTEIEIRTP